MKLIGLSGPLQVGKDTVADYLVAQHNFIRFSFTDALYREVRASFGRPDTDTLVHPNSLWKETPHSDLQLAACDSEDFRRACAEHLFASGDVNQQGYYAFLHSPRSPRWILQMWGTEYRRKQDPDYWIHRAKDFSDAFLERSRAGDLMGVSGLVNTSVRFENERRWLKSEGGEIWHVHRRSAETTLDRSHVAEKGLEPDEDARELYNNSTIEKLNTGISLLLSTQARAIALEG